MMKKFLILVWNLQGWAHHMKVVWWQTIWWRRPVLYTFHVIALLKSLNYFHVLPKREKYRSQPKGKFEKSTLRSSIVLLLIRARTSSCCFRITCFFTCCYHVNECGISLPALQLNHILFCGRTFRLGRRCTHLYTYILVRLFAALHCHHISWTRTMSYLDVISVVCTWI